MQKILVSQQELDEASGQFNGYMHYVKHRLSVDLDPRTALFSAVSLISKDGLTIKLGSVRDAAAQNVENWLNDYIRGMCPHRVRSSQVSLSLRWRCLSPQDASPPDGSHTVDRRR